MGGVMRVMPITLTMALSAPRMLPSTSARTTRGEGSTVSSQQSRTAGGSLRAPPGDLFKHQA